MPSDNPEIKRLFAPAKVNLRLLVGGIRPVDRRHRIATVFLPLNRLGDRVSLAPAAPGAGLSLQCRGIPIPATPNAANLCWRAAEAFCRRAGIAPDWRITLDKEVPVAAGLGGGSADAGAVLRLLNRMAAHLLPAPELSSLALELGADVPFFLAPRPAYAIGAGEVTTPLELGCHFGIVVASPGMPSPVAWAYRRVRPRRGPLPGMPAIQRLASLDALAGLVKNDLAAPLLEKTPLLGMVLEAMRRHGCLAATVSGSGPACFGLCRPGEAEAVCARLRAELADLTATKIFHAGEY